MSHLILFFVVNLVFFELFRETESLQQKEDMPSSIMNQLQV